MNNSKDCLLYENYICNICFDVEYNSKHRGYNVIGRYIASLIMMDGMFFFTVINREVVQ